MKYLAIPILMMLVACGGSNEHANHVPEKDTTSSSIKTLPTDPSSQLLAAYYTLKQSLIDADSAGADNAAIRLSGLADSTDARTLVSDSAQGKQAESLLDSLSIASSQLVKSSDLTGKRRNFSQIGGFMLTLLKQTGYAASTVYIQECPMAFNDTETASWLSDASEIVNPYLGKKHPKYSAGMLHCGELKDSIPSKP